MLTRRPYYACLPGILLRFGVIFSLLLITNICHAIHDGSLLDFNFPSEINLISGVSLEADLILTVKNTGDQRWTACEVTDWPFNEYYPSYRIKVTDQSWNPNAVNVFSKMYHLDPNETDTSTNTIGSMPDDVGEYSFTLECEYHDTECSESYQPMKNTPVIIRFKVVSIGAISGRITDSNGDPIPSLEVVAHAGVNRTEILGVSTTDVNGKYTIGRVRAGRGYVSIKLGEVIIWYDGQKGTEDPIRAREVHITAGQTTIRINIGVTRKAMPWIPLLLLLDSSSPLLGTWTGSAGFGELSFIVNATGTGITEITYTWIDFSCGGFVRNGSIRSTRTSPWPITNNQFIIENTFGPNFEVTLNGTFNQTGTNVSGNWEAVSNGTTCSGTWNASPVQ